jgi:hypothetical protein
MQSHLTYNQARPSVNRYDGNPAVRGIGQPVDMDTFIYLRDNKLVERTEPPSQTRAPGPTRYKITDAGRAVLR